jgi:hypothetical protein
MLVMLGVAFLIAADIALAIAGTAWQVRSAEFPVALLLQSRNRTTERRLKRRRTTHRGIEEQETDINDSGPRGRDASSEGQHAFSTKRVEDVS